MDDVQLITAELIEQVAAQARESPRRRKNYNFHRSAQENPHRFLNVLLEGTYVQPHRHLNPPKAESFLVLSGHCAVVLFNSEGNVLEGYVLGSTPFDGKKPGCVRGNTVSIGIDVQPGIWHTIAALSPVAVCYEVKPGPWDPETDKGFAPWAPPEGSPEAPAYLARLLA